MRASLVEKSHARGYKDFKHLLYANNQDGPLSLAIHPKQLGPVSIVYPMESMFIMMAM